MGFKESHTLISIYTNHLKLGEIIVDIHTYELYKLIHEFFIEFVVFPYIERPHLCDCSEGGIVGQQLICYEICLLFLFNSKVGIFPKG